MVKATCASLVAAAMTVSALLAPAAHASDVPAQSPVAHQLAVPAGGFIPQAAPGWSFNEGISFGTKNFSGVVQDKAGTKYTCAADGGVYSLASSLVSSGKMNAPKQVKSLKVQGNVPSGAKAKKGTVTGKKELGQMAYIASLAGSPSNLDAAATEAALARAGGVYSGSIWQKAGDGTFKAKNAKYLKPADKRSAELYEKAKKYAGPYEATVKLDVPKDSRKGVIKGIGLTAASGKNVPGHAFELTLSGPATFVDGSTSIKEKTAASTQKVDILLTGEGKVTATLKIKGVAHALPWISTGSSDKGRAQNLIVLGKKTDVQAKATAQATSPMFEPSIATEVKDKVIAQGDPLVDVLTVSSASGSWPFIKDTGEPITVHAKVDVYGPFSTPRAQVTDGQEFAESLLGTYDVDVSGEGTLETDGSITAPEEGFYFFQARIDPKDQGELGEKFTEFSSPFFEASETSVVQWQPNIASAASLDVGQDGQAGVRDVITVTGFPEDHGDFGGIDGWDGDGTTISHTLYFIPAQVEHVEGVTEDMEPIAMVETPAGNGEYTIEAGEFPINHDLGVGTYQVVSEFAGDSRVASLRTSDIEPTEQVSLEFGAVRTQAAVVDGGELAPGGTIRDTVILEGIFPDGAYTDVSLYTWPIGQEPVCEEAIWTADRIEHGNEPGEYQTGEFRVPSDAPAVYGFVERTYDRDGNTISAGACGAESETLEAKEEAPPEATSPPEETPPPESTPSPETTSTDLTPPATVPPAPDSVHPSAPVQSSTPAELPNTGFDAKILLPIALGLICAGSIAFLVTRRR
ncbi:MAG: LPXTG cell wall anchor domain-containing protein [Ancrocorticia sp.]|uniref:LPXTG cell wall anchor domain-containing protein n=1 Tax=Ancrocorticia sp. TaxID=2593684 RepID=UPI003F9103A7